jgi:TatD DNase family protein
MLLDAHAHLDHYADGKEIREVMEEIEREKIFTIAVSMDEASYTKTLRRAGRRPDVLPTFGIHPWEAPKHSRHLESFLPLIEKSPMIGEVGLDRRFVKDMDLFPAQRKVFEFFLAAAKQQKKIVNVHTSGAEAEICALLEKHEIERAIIHWYNGPEDVFQQLAARGCYFTFGVELRTNAHIQELAKTCPAERILTETDNPGGAKFLFGQQGRPKMIGSVVRDLAAVRGTTPEAMVQLIAGNFARLIQNDPHMAAAQRFFPKPE